MEYETPTQISARVAAGERLTVQQAMQLRGLDGPGIDSALPQNWVDRVHQRLKLWAPGNVVWSYREEHRSPLFGTPVALTLEGEEIINKMRSVHA